MDTFYPAFPDPVTLQRTCWQIDQDRMAVAEYLKSFPPSNDERPGTADPTVQANGASAATRALRAGDTGMRGSRVYLDNCNACHHSVGSGTIRTFPNLVKNEAVKAKDPISLTVTARKRNHPRRRFSHPLL